MPDEQAAGRELHQSEMPGLRGPRVFVQLATFCETVLQEQTGVRSLVRVYDRLTVQVHHDDILSIPGVPQHLLFVLALKCRKDDTVHEIAIQLVTPDGHVHEESPKQIDFTEDSMDEDMPAAVIQVNVPLLVRVSGQYWFHVIANGDILTSVPLHITVIDRNGEPAVFGVSTDE